MRAEELRSGHPVFGDVRRPSADQVFRHIVLLALESQLGGVAIHVGRGEEEGERRLLRGGVCPSQHAATAQSYRSLLRFQGLARGA